MITIRDVWLGTLLATLFVVPLLRIFNNEVQTLGQELITTTGLLSTVLLVCTVLLPSRIQSLTRVFGIEVVLITHRWMGITTVCMVVAHLVVVLIVNSDSTSLALLVTVRATAGTLSMLCLIGITILMIRRRGRYSSWRFMHVMMAALAVILAVAHIVLISHLIPTWPIVGLLSGDPLGWVIMGSAYLPDPLTTVLLAVLLAVLIAVEIHRWIIRPFSHSAHYCVVRIESINLTLSRIVLSPRSGSAGQWFEAGQFAWVRLRRSAILGEEHPFTVSSASQDYPNVTFTVRHRGNWTEELRSLTPGDDVWLDGPHGAFTLDPLALGGIVLIAGGIGMSPMISILRSMALTPGIRRTVRLIVADRPERLLFTPELSRLKELLDLTVDTIPRENITQSHELAAVLPTGHTRQRQDYYICGPPGLVFDTMKTLRELGVPSHRLHTEQFDM